MALPTELMAVNQTDQLQSVDIVELEELLQQ